MSQPTKQRFIVSVSGHGESGKDEFARLLAKHTGLRYICSTSAVMRDLWWEHIRLGIWSKANSTNVDSQYRFFGDVSIEPDQYPDIDAFYEDRRNHRDVWKRYYDHFNREFDPVDGIAAYKATVNAGNDFLVGIRQEREFRSARDVLINFSIWVSRPGTLIDPTQEYDSDLCDLVIFNNGTLNDLDDEALRVAHILHDNHMRMWGHVLSAGVA